MYSNRVFQLGRGFSDKVVYTAKSSDKVVKSFPDNVVNSLASISDKVHRISKTKWEKKHRGPSLVLTVSI